MNKKHTLFSYDDEKTYYCKIRAMNGVMKHDSVKVKQITSLDAGLSLENNDELAGDIVQIEPNVSQVGDAVLNSPQVTVPS